MDVQKGITDVLLSMGFPGVVIIALGFAVFKLFGRLMDSHDARFTDGRAMTQAMADNSKQLENLSDIIEKRLNK